MRLLYIIMASVTIACGVLLLSWHSGTDRGEDTAIDATRTALHRLDQQIKFRAAVSRRGEPIDDSLTTEVNERGWPISVSPKWFNGTPPVNRLVPAGCPWVEIATGDELSQAHPTVRVALDQNTASFWYNPALGVVRARVGPATSDRKTVERYNRVNGATISSIVQDDAAPVPSVEKPAPAKARSKVSSAD